jgi:prepilin signal peptidase PulO-like enzyme (type II secretory pathway)
MLALLCFRSVAIVLILLAAAEDCRSYRLPLVYTLSAASVAIIGEALFGPGLEHALTGAGTGFLVMKGAQLLSRLRLRKDCLGSGDALLMLAIGALLGMAALPWALGIAGVVAYVVGKRLNAAWLPFGPFLTLAGLVVAIFQWTQPVLFTL